MAQKMLISLVPDLLPFVVIVCLLLLLFLAGI